MIAIAGLDDDGQANILGSFPGILWAQDHAALGNRNATGSEQFFRQILVARYAFGDCWRPVRFGGPDTLTAHSIAELHKVTFGQQANGGNSAVCGSLDDTCGGGA